MELYLIAALWFGPAILMIAHRLITGNRESAVDPEYIASKFAKQIDSLVPLLRQTPERKRRDLELKGKLPLRRGRRKERQLKLQGH
jgi:hypothetical protein